MEEIIIFITIGIRIFAAIGAYWTIVRKLIFERKSIPIELKGYNFLLISSVTTFILVCLGTSLFQACRVGIIPGCQAYLVLDDIALLNSLALLAAYIVMHLIVNTKHKTK